MPKLIDIIKHYRQDHHAIPAFNIDCYEILQAVVAAVKQTNLPAIVQLSAGEDQFIQAENIYMLVKKAQLDGLPLFINMDHGSNITRLKQLLKLGFDMVHFDGSKIDFDTNQLLAKDLISYAHYYHGLVEVEFDHIVPTGSGESGALTDPQVAKSFILNTGADFFAVSIGNQHGAIKGQPEFINLELLTQIQSSIPQTFLTLHGGSGIDSSQISQAINSGIVKINIKTDLRQTYKKALLESVSNPSEKLYEILQPAIDQVTAVIMQKLKSFYV